MKNILSHKVQRGVTWVLHRPVIVRLRQRYPRFTHFIAERFDSNDFLGLPLTLLFLVFFVNMLLLSQLTESVVESEGVVRFDQHFTEMLYNMRSLWLSQVLYVVTFLGTREAVIIVGALATVIFAARRHFIALVAFWVTMGGMGISVFYGKTYFSRERPSDVAYYTVENFSFPSGHATTAMALLGICAYFLFRHLNNKSQRKVTVWVAAILILLVGFTRIYLGVHYLSDVLAGFLLGALWLLIGISLTEVMHYRLKRLKH